MKKFFFSWFLIITMMFTLLGGSSAQAAGLNQKVYHMVKNKWYTEASSGGYDVRFTKHYIKYYNHDSNTVDHKMKILSVKKVKKGYLILIGKKKFEYSYYIKTKHPNSLDFLVAKNQKDINKAKGYSGSSSLTRGRWG